MSDGRWLLALGSDASQHGSTGAALSHSMATPLKCMLVMSAGDVSVIGTSQEKEFRRCRARATDETCDACIQ
jgi:hypothetical protein